MSATFRPVLFSLGSYTRATANGVLTTADLSVTQVGNPFIAGRTPLQLSCQFEIVSGTPTGTLYVEATNDVRLEDSVYAANVVWEVVTSVAFTAGVSPAPNSSSGTIVALTNCTQAVRVRWVPSAGQTGQGWATFYGVSVA
jgi:hypothetical protein